MQTYHRWAPSLGKLEGEAEDVWGTQEYVWWKHLFRPTVFFGMYDLRDFLALFFHRGKKWVLWAGSDVRNVDQGFLFNDGKLKTLSLLFKDWFRSWIIRTVNTAENWTENNWEKETLEKNGVHVEGVQQSFMGDVNKFPICYVKSSIPACHAYLSASEGRQEEYGWGIIERIAGYLPWVTFHLYGAKWTTNYPNVVVHGRVPKELMNKQIEHFHIGLRLNETDGFSEILAKAVLMGQYAIGKVEHPHIPSFSNDMDLIVKIHKISKNKEVNYSARSYYLKNLNKFPWVCVI